MGVALAEDAAGDDEQTVANRLRDEIAAAAPGRLREQVERAAWVDDVVAILERTHEPIAFLLVVGDDAGDVGVERREAGPLHHAWGTDVGELLQLDHFLDQAPRAVGEAETPAGHAVS